MSPTTVPGSPPRRISIDVTETIATGKWSGIERVVRSLTGALTALGAEQDLPVQPVIARNGRFFALNAAGETRLGMREAGAVNASGGRIGAAIATVLKHVPPLFSAVQAARKRRGYRDILLSLSTERPLDLGKGDLVLLLDSYWSGTDALPAAQQARRKGATIVSTVYDLIPITHPELMTPGIAVTFPRALLRALHLSDGVIAISRQSAGDLRGFLPGKLAELPVRAFHLGYETDLAVRHDHGRKDSKGRFRYAVVGTIEPRKNHDVILAALEQRWRSGADCTLTVVGRIGWAPESLLSRMRDHPERGRRLHILNDASDAQLKQVLDEADAVIMASSAEGFGLPIVEALANDVPVIASDISVFREVAGEAAIYFTMGSSAALADAMISFEREPTFWREKARTFNPISWRESAKQVLGALREIAGSGRGEVAHGTRKWRLTS